MKKYLLGVLLVLTFVTTPVFVKAAMVLTFPANIYSIPMADSYRSSGSSLLFVTVPIKKTFTVNSVYTLLITKPIYGLQISADISLASPDSLVRVILKDKSNKDYLVFEGSPSVMEKGSFSIINFCQETCVLNGVIPVSLKIEVLKGSLTLNSIFTIDSSSKLKISSADTPQALGTRLVSQQTNHKISQLNALNTKNGSRWVAGSSNVCNMTYDQKKQLFKDDKGAVPDYLPNLQGFDCYKGGVFSIAGQQIAQIKQASASTVTSAIKQVSASAVASSSVIVPDSWDWRNVNGENWNTPVKNQGGAGTCWAHSNIGTMEAQINLYYNKHLDVNLSEQMLVDCINKGPIVELSTPPSQCEGNNRCYPGYHYCKNIFVGIADEEVDPYAQRDITGSPSVCDSNHIASDWKSRVWKVFDFYDYKFVSDRGTPSCPKQTVDLSEDEYKKILITKGPLDSGVISWNHAMVLVGFDKNNSTGKTIWIYKNSWGVDYGERGYVKMEVTLEDMGWGSLPIGPFTPPTNRSYWPAGFDGKVSCIDKDADNYCNWGISEQPPAGTICPATCKKDSANKYIKDCDDSKNTSGPFISSTNLNCASIQAVYTCTDSDGGKDPYTKGYTVGYDYRGVPTTDTDRVYRGTDGYYYVTEWFCPVPVADGSVYRTNTNIKCLNGYADGRCLRPATLAPAISFISPTAVNRGGTVGVYGTNFNANTYVVLSGYQLGIRPNGFGLTNGATVFWFTVPNSTSITAGYHTVQVVEKGSSFPASNSARLYVSVPFSTPKPTYSPKPTASVTPTPTPVATYTPKPSVSVTPSQTPTPTITPTPTVTVSPEPSPSPVSVSEQVQTASVFSPLSWFWGLFGR